MIFKITKPLSNLICLLMILFFLPNKLLLTRLENIFQRLSNDIIIFIINLQKIIFYSTKKEQNKNTFKMMHFENGDSNSNIITQTNQDLQFCQNYSSFYYHANGLLTDQSNIKPNNSHINNHQSSCEMILPRIDELPSYLSGSTIQNYENGLIQSDQRHQENNQQFSEIGSILTTPISSQSSIPQRSSFHNESGRHYFHPQHSVAHDNRIPFEIEQQNPLIYHHQNSYVNNQIFPSSPEIKGSHIKCDHLSYSDRMSNIKSESSTSGPQRRVVHFGVDYSHGMDLEYEPQIVSNNLADCMGNQNILDSVNNNQQGLHNIENEVFNDNSNESIIQENHKISNKKSEIVVNDQSINILSDLSQFLLPGDILIDLKLLECLLSGESPTNSIQFSNSTMNTWKRCIQVEKDCSENGCFYISLDTRHEQPLSSVERVRESLGLLRRKKEEFSHVLRPGVSEQFDIQCIGVERLLESIEMRSKYVQESIIFRQNNTTPQEQRDYYMQFYDKYSQSLKKAKNIMKEVVNAQGSNKSFVFAQLRAFNPQQSKQEITQLIYSPKLIAILFGAKNVREIFYNQVMRKGIIELFDATGLQQLNSFEILTKQGSRSSIDQFNSTNCTNGNKINLILFTVDNFQIPITITLKKYNLGDDFANQNTPDECHILHVFDIKIKIKYQKQLKNFRENLQSSKIKKSKQNNCSQKQNDLNLNQKRASISLYSEHQPTSDLPEEQIQSEYTNEKQQEYFGYYLESLGFLNKFYPEKVQKNEKLNKELLLKKKLISL